jgi:hypothetical protein
LYITGLKFHFLNYFLLKIYQMFFPCEIYAAFILVFVVGYSLAWYRYNIPPVHVVVRKDPPLPPLPTPIAPPGPGSERFYQGGDDGPLHNYDKEQSEDHDNQVISRMRK